MSSYQSDHSELEESTGFGSERSSTIYGPRNTMLLDGAMNSPFSTDYTLCLCRMLSIFATISLLGLIFVDLITLILSSNIEKFRRAPLHFILIVYCICFSMVAVLFEMELTEGIRSIRFLQSWCIRGLFYIFLAAFSLDKLENSSNFFAILCAAAVFLCGTCYTILVLIIVLSCSIRHHLILI